ncbi:hypothetical protein K3U93_11145 [Mycobacterium malmoense]|uniref:Uncharacterized protein n=1 Tax=Mycobacterium malmoense TaxID=1780 RepID=A0ABX3SR39_MYCMA|nr:hypothetical protein [Mycobacterium malmoense]OIN81988.1 hypothetical protein BMG05_04655 [Mycobacterium malmoense]ORA80431.1 hypothetical protein BST29_16565 [Mycobacterium malmoense]QZA19606.1 hypothetical protein K3U93_11145 [Mycobacterium malmoense]UNB96358.1 hypothetical protein H5T25_11135 [Mycobacterium malmoense]
MSEQLTAEVKQLENRLCDRLNEARYAPVGLRDGVAIVDLLAKIAAELEVLEGKPDGPLA